MNWHAMGLMAAILGFSALCATAGVYLIERGVHPAWIVGAMFLAAILAAGVLIR